MALSAQEYQSLTSYQRNRIPLHFLDWENQPSTLKTYPNTPTTPLPKYGPPCNESFSLRPNAPSKAIPARQVETVDLAGIIGMAHAITRRVSYPGGVQYYRSVASAGALYPTELYVATTDVKGIRDGLYHVSVDHQALAEIRQGDVSVLAGSALARRPENLPTLVFFLSVIFFRSSWKYRDRAYRYHLLDTGHLLENLTVALQAHGLSFTVSYDFDDRAANRLLGLDENKEACLCVCCVPGSRPFNKDQSQTECRECPDAIKGASIVSNREVDYPLIQKIHQAGQVGTCGRSTCISDIHGAEDGQRKTLETSAPVVYPERPSFSETFHRRRSQRNFVSQSVTNNQLMGYLESLLNNDCQLFRGPYMDPNTFCMGLIVNHGEGIAPGYYALNPSRCELEIVKPGRYTEQMAHVCLDQAWLAHAAIHFLFIADLARVDAFWGCRGYRHIMMHAGRLGERLYLESAGMGLGCCGIGAFYDGEAAELLGLENPMRLLYLVAAGPVKSLLMED
jgi:SagB-type dehydrogenase family enzyme